MVGIPFQKQHLQGDMQLAQDLKCDYSWNSSLTFHVLVTISDQDIISILSIFSAEI